MPTTILKADYPDWADPEKEEAIFQENAQRMAQALVDRGYKNVSVTAEKQELSLTKEPEPASEPEPAHSREREAPARESEKK